MSKFVKLYSINKDKTEGSFESLLDAVKKLSDVKIGLKIESYEEIIPFINIAYSDDFVVGIANHLTSSLNLRIFKENLKRNKNYKDTYLFFSNKDFIALRSSLNEIPNMAVFNQSNYEYYNWFAKNENYELVFTSPDDYSDLSKKKFLINKIKEGSNLKIKVQFKGINYILAPTIEYFNFDENNDLSIKTHPYINFNNFKEKQQIFRFQELIANLNGEVSILESKQFFMNKPHKNISIKIFNFLMKKLKINLQLTGDNKINHYLGKKKLNGLFVKYLNPTLYISSN